MSTKNDRRGGMVSKNRFLKRALSLLLAVALCASINLIPVTTALAEERPGIEEESYRGQYETLLSLARLNKLGHIMFFGAHPDDESAAFLAYVHDSPRYNVDASYLTSNWGEGGENDIGPEFYDGLGVLRSQELNTARAFDRGTQYYLGMFDTGYSPSLELSLINRETGEMGIYDPNVYIYQLTKVIRLTRPDAVLAHHGYSGHGQHQACNYALMVAINAAKNANYKIYDDDGNSLEAWEVKRVMRSGSGSNGGSTTSFYVQRQDPYVPSGMEVWNAVDGDPVTWANHTYNMIGRQGYNHHLCQKRSGNAEDIAPNNTVATTYYVDTNSTPAAYQTIEKTEDVVNSDTMLASIDTSISRVNKSLSNDDQIATNASVEDLKTALDNVVEKFPNGPAAADMLADGAPDTYNKEPGDSDAATVEAQIAAVSADLRNASDALAALELYAESNPNMQGVQEYKYYLEMVRERLEDFVSKLYGINYSVEVSDSDPHPGQTITITARLESLDTQFADTVNFPATAMSNGLPTVISVPEGSVVSANDPTEYSETGRIYGDYLPVKGYKYTYTVTIPNDYQEYTGPVNAPYNENYYVEEYGGPSPTYPVGSSDYQASDYANSTNAYNINPPSPETRNVKIDVTTDQVHPYAIPFVLGEAEVEIEGKIYGLYDEPEVRLSPKISLWVQSESQAVMLKKSDEAQLVNLNVEVRNNMTETADVTLSGVIKEGNGGNITIDDTSTTVSAKGTKIVTLVVNVPAGFEGSPVINVVAKLGSETFNEGYYIMSYNHLIADHHWYKSADMSLAVADFSLPSDDIRIGFAGTTIDDVMYDYIKAMYSSPAKAEQNCIMLRADDITVSGAALKTQFDTIVVGKTGFGNTVRSILDLENNGQNLLDFANLGGNLVVHYQNQRSIPASIAPKSFDLSINGPGNLNVPYCDVYIDEGVLDHPLYNYPNNIDLAMDDYVAGTGIPEGYSISRSDVWDNWKQQRCEWCPSSVSVATNEGYKVLFAGRDIASQNLRPAIEYMEMENEGHYYYCSVVWDRQFTDLVPGAYKLYANMISTGFVAAEPEPTYTLTMNQPEDAEATVGEPFSKTISVTYTGADALDYSTDSILPTGISLNPSSGEFSGTPEAETEGDYPITVSVNDGTLNDSGSFMLTVNAVISSAALKLTLPANDTVNVGEHYTKTLEVTYTGSNTLKYSATGLPSSLTIDTVIGVISGTLTQGDIGEHTIMVTVDDGSNLSDTKEFSLTVVGAEAFTVTYEAGKDGRVSSSHTNGDTVKAGDTVSITATANSNYRFSGWTANDVSSGAANPGIFTITQDTHIVANFAYTGGSGSSGSPSRGSSSGGSTSSSGSSSYAISIEEKKLGQPTVASMDIKASTDKNGNAAFAITDNIVKALIEKAQKQASSSGKAADGVGIMMNLLPGSTAKSLVLTIEGKVISRMNSTNDLKLLGLENPLANISLDAAAIKAITSQSSGDVIITITPIPEDDLSDGASAIIGSRPVYDITVSYTKNSKTSYITDYKDGNVTIGIAYKPKKSEVAENLYAVYVTADGNPELLLESNYDNERVIFSRNTLSVYGVGYKSPAPSFIDTAGHWAKDNIDFVASRGFLTGTGETMFSPDITVTRGMFITALGKLSGQDIDGYSTSGFSDVPVGSYYLPYIEWAATNKLVSGVGDDKFEPDKAITREEMTVILVNYANAANYSFPIIREAITFADSLQISSWAEGAVRTLQQAGIVSGVGDDCFNPRGTATRAEAATVLRYFAELLIDSRT